jgi:hypothetical protein
MSRERELLLARVRHAEDPTPADEERVLRALEATLAAGREASPSAQAAERVGSWAQRTAPRGLAALKVSAAVAAMAVVAVGALLWHTAPDPGSTPSARPAAVGGAAAPRDAGPEQLEAPSPAGSEASRDLEGPRAPQRATSARSEPAEPRVIDSLRAEVALLERVQAALRRNDGVAALRELDAHRTSDRTLLAERETARILALCLVGQVLEARRAARRFEAQHPDSPQRAVIAGSCANSRRIEEP